MKNRFIKSLAVVMVLGFAAIVSTQNAYAGKGTRNFVYGAIAGVAGLAALNSLVITTRVITTPAIIIPGIVTAAITILTIIIIVSHITAQIIARTTGPDTRRGVKVTIVVQLRGHGHGIAIVPTNTVHSGALMAHSSLTMAGVASAAESIENS